MVTKPWLMALVALFVSRDVLALDWASTAKADLDGDGNVEAVELHEKEGTVTVKAGKASLSFATSSEDGVGVAVIDLDNSDKKKELLVRGSSANDYADFDLLRFEGGKLLNAGRVSTQASEDPDASGNGSIVFKGWAGFFTRVEKYVLDAKGQLKEVVPELYGIDTKVKTKESFALLTSRTKKDVLAKVAAGGEITIVAYDPSPKCKANDMGFEGCDWFLIRSSKGLLGWVSFEILSKSAELPWAG